MTNKLLNINKMHLLKFIKVKIAPKRFLNYQFKAVILSAFIYSTTSVSQNVTDGSEAMKRVSLNF